MPDGSPPVAASTAYAAVLFGEAVRLGLREVVLCPGSRSQALALVAADLEARGLVRLHVRIDERSAAFFALGLARESGRPVTVVTTSGTAVANLHPAMLEAFHAGIPLVALTADRPAELIGIGANQATIQPGMFGDRVPCVDIPAPDAGDDPDLPASARHLASTIMSTQGPLHVNVAFRAPLSTPVGDLLGNLEPGPGETWKPAEPPGVSGAAVSAPRIHRIDPSDGVPTLVVAGDLAGPIAERVAHEGGWPLIAEVSSGARFGRNLVVAYRDLLGGAAPELRDLVRRVLVFGHPTLSREVPALIERADVETIAVGPSGGEPYNPGHRIARRVDCVAVVGSSGDPAIGNRDAPGGEKDAPGRVDPRAWLRAWVGTSHDLVTAASSDPPAPDLDAARSREHAERSSFAFEELAVARQPVDRAMLVDAVWRATWPHDRLVLGASRLVRVLDGRAAGRNIRVHANRGLAGIDGTIAAALGVATAAQGDAASSAANGVTRLLLGDLAFVHDASSLLVEQGGEAAPRVQVIVGNDGGGTIFDSLEVAATAGDEAMSRVLYTPQGADIGAIAAAYGWHHQCVSTRSELEAALTARTHDRVVIEVPLER